MRDKFLEPPFSVLDTKGGGWQTRKRQWKKLGIESHLGREAETTSISDWDKPMIINDLPPIQNNTNFLDDKPF